MVNEFTEKENVSSSLCPRKLSVSREAVEGQSRSAFIILPWPSKYYTEVRWAKSEMDFFFYYNKLYLVERRHGDIFCRGVNVTAESRHEMGQFAVSIKDSHKILSHLEIDIQTRSHIHTVYNQFDYNSCSSVCVHVCVRACLWLFIQTSCCQWTQETAGGVNKGTT